MCSCVARVWGSHHQQRARKQSNRWCAAHVSCLSYALHTGLHGFGGILTARGAFGCANGSPRWWKCQRLTAIHTAPTPTPMRQVHPCMHPASIPSACACVAALNCWPGRFVCGTLPSYRTPLACAAQQERLKTHVRACGWWTHLDLGAASTKKGGTNLRLLPCQTQPQT